MGRGSLDECVAGRLRQLDPAHRLMVLRLKAQSHGKQFELSRERSAEEMVGDR